METHNCQECGPNTPVAILVEDGESHKFCEWCWAGITDWAPVA